MPIWSWSWALMAAASLVHRCGGLRLGNGISLLNGGRLTRQVLKSEVNWRRLDARSYRVSCAAGAKEKDVRSAITPRTSDYSTWYGDVLEAAEMFDHSPVRGCMVIRPWGMSVWDSVRRDLDGRIATAGVSNAYFPLFIPLSFLEKEAAHVDGFAKECAVVTHHRLHTNEEGQLVPDPAAKLEEPLVVRPTSETVIWNMYSKWIQSHRDLPLKLNQWANVVRWEMRTRPFLRSSEFLWQEGHTAHASAQDALEHSREMLDVYAALCHEVLAVPVIQGVKSPSERFAGAEDTFTIEAMMQNGWALQSGTSHYLGQNFAKAFDVQFTNESNHREFVYATSWGVSTRLIGALIMTHSDDNGLVLPPAVAPQQVVIVPILSKSAEKNQIVLDQCHAVEKNLRKAGIRVKVDSREEIRHGAKYFEWERKGVPLRIDIGPRDVENQSLSMSVRHSGEKMVVPVEGDQMRESVSLIQNKLKEIQSDLLARAEARLESRMRRVDNYEDMKTAISELSTDELGFFLVPWRCDAESEAAIKTDCKATVRCYPFKYNQQPPAPGVKCFYSGEQATHMAIFARAF